MVTRKERENITSELSEAKDWERGEGGNEMGAGGGWIGRDMGRNRDERWRDTEKNT